MLRPQLVQAQANKEAEEARQDAYTARREAELLRIQLEEERAVTAHAGVLLSHAEALAMEGPSREHPRPPLPHCHSPSSLESASGSSSARSASGTNSPSKSVDQTVEQSPKRVEQSPTPTYQQSLIPLTTDPHTYSQTATPPLGCAPKGWIGCGTREKVPLTLLVTSQEATSLPGLQSTRVRAAGVEVGTTPSSATLSSCPIILAAAPAPARSFSSSPPSASSSRFIGWMCMVTCCMMAMASVRPHLLCACFRSAVQVVVEAGYPSAAACLRPHESGLVLASWCHGLAQARQEGEREATEQAHVGLHDSPSRHVPVSSSCQSSDETCHGGGGGSW
jgi:hypothetical protein